MSAEESFLVTIKKNNFKEMKIYAPLYSKREKYFKYKDYQEVITRRLVLQKPQKQRKSTYFDVVIALWLILIH